MGTFREKEFLYTSAGITQLAKDGYLFNMSSGAAVLANNGSVSMKIYATAAQYPDGIRVRAMVDSDSGPWSISVSTYSTFTFSTYAATTDWRYPTNVDLRSSVTLTSVTMASSTKASTPAAIRTVYVSGRPTSEPVEFWLKPAVGYRLMATNLSGGNRSYGYTVNMVDIADDQM